MNEFSFGKSSFEANFAYTQVLKQRLRQRQRHNVR